MALRASLARLATVLLLLLPAHTDWVAPAAAREECAGVGRQTLAPGAVRALRLRGGAGGAGGGGVPSTPHGAEHTDPAWLWEREFDQLAGPSSQSRHRAAFFSAPQQESEGGESLFRQAFFLTHYRLDFAVARQLLERVLVLNPQHVPALTTLVSPALPSLRAVEPRPPSTRAVTLLCVGQGQLLYLAYNDYDMAEGVLSRALQIEPGHLLARMHVDLVRSLRRAAALLPYQPLAPPRRVAYAQAAAVKMDDAAWDEVRSRPRMRARPSARSAPAVALGARSPRSRALARGKPDGGRARALWLRANAPQLTGRLGSATRARGSRPHRLGQWARKQAPTPRGLQRGTVLLLTICPRNGPGPTAVATLWMLHQGAATRGGRRGGATSTRPLSLRTVAPFPILPCPPTPLPHDRHKNRERLPEQHTDRHTHLSNLQRAHRATQRSGAGNNRARRSRAHSSRAHSSRRPRPLACRPRRRGQGTAWSTPGSRLHPATPQHRHAPERQ